jgi:hypothetical protein
MEAACFFVLAGLVLRYPGQESGPRGQAARPDIGMRAALN